ncbi:MAG: hypothetical protein PHT92_03350, partial [Bacteroidales bacterium]|nr:hypothetical protein [Bacteroidales bacterium]
GFINQGNLVSLKLKETMEFDERVVLLVKGEVTEGGQKVLSAPSLIMGGSIKANMASILFVLPVTD